MSGRAERSQYWNTLIQEHAASGLSQAEFCRRMSVSVGTFRQHLYSRPRQQRCRATTLAPAQGTPLFIPVKLQQTPTHHVSPAQHSSSTSALEIRLPQGYRIAVGAEFDSDTLTRLLDLLEQRAC